MIETEQKVQIDAAIDDIWNHVRQIERWAETMPGYQSCALIDDDRSRWTLKIGVGGLLRTVIVMVEVERWISPERVDFHYWLDGDPVEGHGVYQAEKIAPDCTQIALRISVKGGGPMAAMWEALGRPLLPRFVKAFAVELKAGIEVTLVAG